MAHRLEYIRICNFRSCKSAEFRLAEFTPLVGYNNAGKSNILSAIKWFIRRSSLSPNEFNNEKEQVIVEGLISGISNELLGRLDEKHRKSIEPYVEQGNLRLRRIQKAPGDSTKKISLEVYNNANGGEWGLNPAGIDNAIAVLFPDPITVGAMEDAEEDVTKNKTSTTIGKLIAELLSPIEERHGKDIQDALAGLKRKLGADGTDRAPEITALDEAANEKLAEFFPGVKLRLHVPTPEIKEVLKGGTIRVYEEGDEIGKEVTAIGHGAQRSIQMSLIRHLADIKRADDADDATTLLLIDEPELYLHPQGVEQVRVALKKLSAEGYQVIFSTHSPQMIVADDVQRSLLIRKADSKGTIARKRLDDAVRAVIEDAPSQLELLFSLASSSQILFSEIVILAEGKTEQRLLPLIFEKVTGKTFGQEKMALIGQGGVGNTSKSLSVLAAMDLPAKAIVDLDYAFRGAPKDRLLDEDDGRVKICREAMVSISEKNDICLSEDGFPKRRGSSMSVSDAIGLLCSNDEASAAIQEIHNDLKAKGIWLWTKGNFEKHLGLNAKGEGVWTEFSRRIYEEACEDVITDYKSVIEMLDWLRD